MGLRFPKLFSAFAFKTRCASSSLEGTTVELKAPGEEGQTVVVDLRDQDFFSIFFEGPDLGSGFAIKN